MTRQCEGIVKGGERCSRIISDNERWCFGHHPERAQERKENAAKAARAKAPGGEIARVKARIKEISEGVLSGEFDKARGSVCIQGYGVLKGFLELERKAKEERELQELQEHVARLEAMADNVKRLRR